MDGLSGALCRSHLALLYNDRGVLENHHISAAYRLTQLPAFNIFINVPRSKFQYVIAPQFLNSLPLIVSLAIHLIVSVVGKLLTFFGF